jgi:uncharacterized protein YqgC (DUF456 family)
MPVVLYVLGVALLAAGVAGLVLPILPGAALLVAGVLALAWAGDFAIVGWGTVAFSAALGLLITAVDWAASLLGAKAFGASRWALLGSAVGLVVPVLPGAALLVAGVVALAWAGDFAIVGWGTVAFAAGLGLLMTVVDWGATVLGAKAFGASRWAVVGAMVGLLVGLFLGLPGILLGPAVGALLFEYAKDPDFARAAKAGAGTLVGFVVGSVVKVALAFVLLGAVALRFLVG